MNDQWTAPGADPTRPPAEAPPVGGFAPPGGPAYPPPGGYAPVGNPSCPPAGGPAYPSPGGYPPPVSYPPPGGHVPVGVPAWRPAYDFRPGIIPLRPLQLGDLYGAVIKAVRGNVAATVGLAALTSVMVLLPLTAAGSVLAATDSSSLSPTGAAPFGFGAVASWLPNVGTMFSAILLAGFMAYVIGQAVLGRKVTLRETWEGTKGRVLRLIGATLLIFLIVLGVALVVLVPCIAFFAGVVGTSGSNGPGAGTVAGGLLAFLLVGLLLIGAIAYVTTRLSFVTPAIVLEGQSVTGGLARSWRMVGGWRRQPFWRLLGIRLLTSMIVSIASSIVTVPLMAIAMAIMFSTISQGGPASTLFLVETVLTGLTGILAGALTTPFTAGIDALLYVDTRIRQEGLDVTLMRAVDGTSAVPWPSAVPQ